MVKKLKQMAAKQSVSPSSLLDSVLAGNVKESAHQIWLAGMGAYSRAQAEGTKVFEALVKEGGMLQKKTQNVAEEKINEVTSKMTNMAGDVQARAGQHWDKLEGIFEERTSKALNKLGVPSAKDVATLVARIDALSAKVDKLSKAAAPKVAASKKAVAKPVAKRATARKSAA